MFSETVPSRDRQEPRLNQEAVGRRGKFMEDLVLVSKAGSEILKK